MFISVAHEGIRKTRERYAGGVHWQRCCVAADEEMVQRWEAQCPRLSRLLREGFEDCRTVHGLPIALRRRLHSTSKAERVMREIKRRIKLVGILPNESS